MSRSTFAVVVASVVVAVSGCSEPHRAEVNARFLNGATPKGAGAGLVVASVPSAPPGNGQWSLSPDRITLHLVEVMFITADGNGAKSATVECEVTYDKAKSGLTELANCPFVLEAGTYKSVNLFFKDHYDLYVNDAVNGFYTTATGIVTTPPAGGAQPFSFAVPKNVANGRFAQSPIDLPTPLVVSDSAPVTLSVVINGLHSFLATVTDGVVTTDGGTSPQTPGMVASVGTVAGVEYYSNSLIGTGDSYCIFHCSVSRPNGVTNVAMYYTSPTTPMMAAVALNGPPACMNGAVYSIVQGAKSYIAQDASNNLGWALPRDQQYTTYASEMRMARLSTIGQSTTLYCKARDTDPAPSGGSYASGAPAINQSANAIGTYVLVAK